MYERIAIALVVLCFGSLAGGAEEAIVPERQMNVTQGPDAVFGRPAEQVVGALAGARPTGENGRIGSELVFWGYAQPDGQRVFLFACAADIDCGLRLPAICPAATTVIQQGQAPGTVVRRQCRSVVLTRPGDVRPGCEDRTETVTLAVGLVTCG